VTEWRKQTLGEPGSVGGHRANSVWLWFRQHYRSDWIKTFTMSIFIQFHLVEDQSHAGMETSLLRMAVVSMKPTEGGRVVDRFCWSCLGTGRTVSVVVMSKHRSFIWSENDHSLEIQMQNEVLKQSTIFLFMRWHLSSFKNWHFPSLEDIVISNSLFQDTIQDSNRIENTLDALCQFEPFSVWRLMLELCFRPTTKNICTLVSQTAANWHWINVDCFHNVETTRWFQVDFPLVLKEWRVWRWFNVNSISKKCQINVVSIFPRWFNVSLLSLA